MSDHEKGHIRYTVGKLLEDCVLARRLGYKSSSIRAMQIAIVMWRKELQGADAAAQIRLTQELHDRYLPID